MARKTSQRAKRLLQEAVAHVGHDVIVIAPGVNGDGYLASSMSTRTSQDIEHLITLTNEALKKLRRWQRHRAQDEKRAAKNELTA